MPKYIVINPIKSGGKRHMPNAEIDIDAKDAKALLESGDIKAAEAKSVPTLVGSSKLPAQIELAKGKKVPLDNVVKAAFKKSGLSEEQWNALPEDEREAKLAETIETMQGKK